jgi:hypothetical protein
MNEENKDFLTMLMSMLSNMVLVNVPGLKIPNLIRKLSTINNIEYDIEAYDFTFADWMKINGVDENSSLDTVFNFLLLNMSLFGIDVKAQAYKVLCLLRESSKSKSKSQLDAFLDGDDGEISIDDLLK